MNRLNETQSQEKLLNVMLQEGIEWLGDYGYCFRGTDLEFCFSNDVPTGLKNHTVSREQYAARDGWITWHGGVCPVNGNVFVDTMYPAGIVEYNVEARYYYWETYNDKHDIIAYRIHKEPREVESCEPATGDPVELTIEQLLAEWKQCRSKEIEERNLLNKQQEAYNTACSKTEQALERVQDKLAELGWSDIIRRTEAEKLDITDWRNLQVGDIIWIGESSHVLDCPAGEVEILSIDGTADRQPLHVKHPTYGGAYPDLTQRGWRFVRRHQS